MKQKFIHIGEIYIKPENIVSFGIEKDGTRYLFVNVIYDNRKDSDTFEFWENLVDFDIDEKLKEISGICAEEETPVQTPEARLERLMKLYEKGIITEKEYQDQRKAIIKDI